MSLLLLASYCSLREPLAISVCLTLFLVALQNNLMIKRARLKEQLEEAKTLKENIDRRALQVRKLIKNYL